MAWHSMPLLRVSHPYDAPSNYPRLPSDLASSYRYTSLSEVGLAKRDAVRAISR